MVSGAARRRGLAILAVFALGTACVSVDLPPRPLEIEGADASDPDDASPDLGSTAPKDGGALADGERPDVASPPADAARPGDTAPIDTRPPADTALPPDAAIPRDLPASPDTTPPVDHGSSSGKGRVGLIVGDANVLLPADTLARSRLQARGLTVTVIDELAASPSDAVDRDLLVISSSITTRQAALDRITPFRGSAVPILCLAVHVCDVLAVTPQMGVQSGEVPDDDSINVTATAHPLAAGLAAGLVPVMQPKSGEHWVLYWMNPHTTATRVASMRNAPSKVAIFGLEKGIALSTEQLAPARRVVFTLMPTSYNGNYQLSATGISLLDAAIAWALQ